MINKKLVLFLVLAGYAFLYVATTKQLPCDDDCEKTGNMYQDLSAGRTYVLGVFRCTYPRLSDSLCVFVRDTTGINWDLFADTACIAATRQGLLQQKIFVIKNVNLVTDTVARKVCP
jgi:hypothetical protein